MNLGKDFITAFFIVIGTLFLIIGVQDGVEGLIIWGILMIGVSGYRGGWFRKINLKKTNKPPRALSYLTQ